MRGVTLLEMLCVLAIFGVIASFSVFISIASYQAISVRQDAQLLATLLRSARNASMHRLCASSSCDSHKSHGVYISSTSSVMYEGCSYAARDSDHDMTFPITHGVENPVDISFGSDGEASQPQEISVGAGGTSWEILVDGAGRVIIQKN